MTLETLRVAREVCTTSFGSLAGRWKHNIISKLDFLSNLLKSVLFGGSVVYLVTWGARISYGSVTPVPW